MLLQVRGPDHGPAWTQSVACCRCGLLIYAGVRCWVLRSWDPRKAQTGLVVWGAARWWCAQPLDYVRRCTPGFASVRCRSCRCVWVCLVTNQQVQCAAPSRTGLKPGYCPSHRGLVRVLLCCSVSSTMLSKTSASMCVLGGHIPSRPPQSSLLRKDHVSTGRPWACSQGGQSIAASCTTYAQPLLCLRGEGGGPVGCSSSSSSNCVWVAVNKPQWRRQADP